MATLISQLTPPSPSPLGSICSFSTSAFLFLACKQVICTIFQEVSCFSNLFLVSFLGEVQVIPGMWLWAVKISVSIFSVLYWPRLRALWKMAQRSLARVWSMRESLSWYCPVSWWPAAVPQTCRVHRMLLSEILYPQRTRQLSSILIQSSAYSSSSEICLLIVQMCLTSPSYPPCSFRLRKHLWLDYYRVTFLTSSAPLITIEIMY